MPRKIAINAVRLLSDITIDRHSIGNEKHKLIVGYDVGMIQEREDANGDKYEAFQPVMGAAIGLGSVSIEEKPAIAPKKLIEAIFQQEKLDPEKDKLFDKNNQLIEG